MSLYKNLRKKIERQYKKAEREVMSGSSKGVKGGYAFISRPDRNEEENIKEEAQNAIEQLDVQIQVGPT
jgi:hypothetical protein